jgi:cob(I)alamin adenosyltransferase
MRKRYFAIYTFVLVVLLAGCQSQNNSAPSTPNNSTTPNAIQKTTQPKQLETIESNSEDIIDDLVKNDWIAAKAKVDEMKTALAELKPQLQSANVSASLINGVQSSLAELEKQVAIKQTYQSKVQANAITKFIPDIADAYEAPLPTDLGRLDYYGREIILNVENKDWTAASDNIKKSKEIWLNLKQKLNDKYKNDIDQFNKSLDNLNNQISKQDAALTSKEANNLLELIDTLERDFNDQKK